MGLLALHAQEHLWSALPMIPALCTLSSKVHLHSPPSKLPMTSALGHFSPHSPSSWVVLLGHTRGRGSRSLSSTQDPWSFYFLYLGLDSGLDQGLFRSCDCLSGELGSLTVATLILITTVIAVTG